MADSPALNSEGPVRFAVLVGGHAIPSETQIVSIRVLRQVGVVPTARLIVIDGDMPNASWPLADSATFAPGATVTIKAGYADQEDTIFEGLITKLGMRIDGENYSRLIVDCHDEAVKMTVGRKNRTYIDDTDSSILSTVVSSHGLSADIESTSIQYGELVQYYCTDWDFLMSRAEVNGLLVIADNGKLLVKAPAVGAAAVLRVTWGVDLFEFQAEIDARNQLASVEAVAWDPKTQAILQQTAKPASLNAQGNLSSDTLAKVLGVPTYRLQSATPLTTDALKAWASAQQVKAGLSRIRGRMTFQGSAKAKVGSLIEVAAVGARYNGDVFVSGLEHEISDGNWVTHADFGLAANWFAERTDVVSPPAAGWLPGAEGLQVGIVKKLDSDPLGEYRVEVNLPVLKGAEQGVWARLMQYYASNSFGAFYVPEIGDEVVLGYFNNDPSNPVILGSLYSSKQVPPYTLSAENNIKALVTRSKTKIEIDDDKKIVTITTPGDNKIVISDDAKSILLSDQNGNTVTLKPEGIILDSPKDITLKAAGSVTVEAMQKISLTATTDLAAKGLNVTAEAQVALTAKGTASAELSASGMTTVKGSMVMIN